MIAVFRSAVRTRSAWARRSRQIPGEGRRDVRHVAGHDEHGVPAGGRERRMQTAERSAVGHDVGHRAGARYCPPSADQREIGRQRRERRELPLENRPALDDGGALLSRPPKRVARPPARIAALCDRLILPRGMAPLQRFRCPVAERPWSFDLRSLSIQVPRLWCVLASRTKGSRTTDGPGTTHDARTGAAPRTRKTLPPHGCRPVRKTSIGRVLVASLHQGIADILPTRLGFYENWLNAEGLREGTIGLAPVPVPCWASSGRRSGTYQTIHGAGRGFAAEWTVQSMPPFRRSLVRSDRCGCGTAARCWGWRRDWCTARQ